MAMSKTDTAELVTNLYKKVSEANPDATTEELYKEVFSQIKPLLISCDIDSEIWVEISEFYFPDKENSKESLLEKVEDLEKTVESLKDKLNAAKGEVSKLAKINDTLTDELVAAKKAATVTSTPKPSTTSSDPCGPSMRLSSRGGGC